MGSYALVKDGVVINTILWDGQEKSPIDFGDGVSPVELEQGASVQAGYFYKSGKFTEPPPTEEELALQAENAKLANRSQKENMMSESSLRISILQDAVDLDMATDEEAAALPKWKKYRVLLSRIDADTSEAVDWPAKPDF